MQQQKPKLIKFIYLQYAKIVYLLMNNRVNDKNEVQQNIQFLYKDRPNKNKQQIQLFYARNKMKFPPIIQSKEFITKMSQNKTSSTNKLSSIQSSQNSTLKNYQHYTNINPNICRIEFKNDKSKRIMPINEAILQNNKGNIIQTISHSPRRYYISEDKKKDIHFLNSNNNNGNNIILQRFIQQLSTSKHNHKNNYIISKSLQHKSHLNSPSIKPLLITKMNHNHRNQILTNSSKPYNHEIHSYQKQEKAYFLQKPQKFMFLKKRIVRKQGFFEPWQQQNFPQQDF